jgi:hypothetical protein
MRTLSVFFHSGIDTGSGGTITWANPGNAYAPSPGYATATSLSPGTSWTSNVLQIGAPEIYTYVDPILAIWVTGIGKAITGGGGNFYQCFLTINGHTSGDLTTDFQTNTPLQSTTPVAFQSPAGTPGFPSGLSGITGTDLHTGSITLNIQTQGSSSGTQVLYLNEIEMFVTDSGVAPPPPPTVSRAAETVSQDLLMQLSPVRKQFFTWTKGSSPNLIYPKAIVVQPQSWLLTSGE